MSFVIHTAGVSVTGFMAEVATNDKFSGLYIGTYGVGGGGGGGGGGGQQHQRQQQQQQRDEGCGLLQAQDVCGRDAVVIGYDNLDAYVEYADSLAKCGRVCESLDLYARCFRVVPLPANFLWHVTSAFLDAIQLQADDGRPAGPAAPPTPSPFQREQQQQQQQQQQWPSSYRFDCGTCELVLRDPVTLLCGHTFCRRCIAADVGGCGKPSACHKCGLWTPYQPHANVLVKSLVEKLWPAQLRASELLDEGKDLYRQDKLHSALLKFNQAYYTGNENYDLLNIRSRTLLKLGLNENALVDADRVVQIKPKWSKGHFTRGMTLLSLGKYHEALLEFSLSAVLGENLQKLKTQISEVLQRLLIMYSKETDAPDLDSWDPISNDYLRSYLNTFINGSNECENNINALIKKPIEHEHTLKKLLCEINTITELIQYILVEIMCTKHYTPNVQNNNTLKVDKSLLDESDFNCVLCCGVFRNPVTTPCGHTYCLECLEHNFDYSFHCPLCLTSLPPSLALSKKNTVEFVDEMICAKYSKYRLMRTVNWQPEVHEHDSTYLPVFVCTNAFPSVSCPLHVFEPRYRLMIRRCIESGTRRFAMISHCCPPMKFAEYGTVLEIKDRIMMGNGCSFISTVGTQRFKVLVRKEHDGYDMAKVQYIQDEKVPQKKLSELKQLHDDVRLRGLSWFNSFRPEIKSEILRTVGFPPCTEQNWEQSTDGPAWTWWLLSLLPLGPNAHVDLLANTSIEVRLKVINKILGRIERSSLSRRITSSPVQQQ